MSIEITKLKILDTAIELFWKAGYQSTNMNELSRHAGVNKATVYQHFGSKEALAIEAVKLTADRTISFMFEPSFAATQNPIERIEQIYQRAYKMHAGFKKTEGACRGCPMVNIGVEMASSSEDVHEAVKAALLRFENYYRKIIDDLRKQGLLRLNTKTTQLSRDLQDNMNAALVSAKLHNDPKLILAGGKRAISYLT